MMRPEALVISAPSGAGKSSVIRQLMQGNTTYGFSISTTSREMRKGEQDGVDYYFVSRDQFEDMIGQDMFLEWADVHGNYYGTSKKEIDRIAASQRIPILDIDVQGVKQVKPLLPGAVFVFIIPPGYDELKKRLEGRGDTPQKDINLRLKNATDELQSYELFDYLVINDNLEKAVMSVRTIVQAEAHSTRVMDATIKNILEDFNDHTS